MFANLINLNGVMTIQEDILINTIKKKVLKGNIDNISRTQCYERFYFQYPDIQWALLAAFVSRNAGWNMCDLKGHTLSDLLTPSYSKQLFLTYERSNWLIFQDAYPQLLLYHYSTIFNKPWFHLLSIFNVSKFMEKEWNYYWENRDKQRLLYALIINEQNVIQKPVIEKDIFKRRIFHSLPYKMNDLMHYSIVLFPTLSGELYGASVEKFQKLDERIELGKKLAAILFHENVFDDFIQFAKRTVHTGSRYDYEQYFQENIIRKTPFLRIAFPIIQQTKSNEELWDVNRKVKEKWFGPPKLEKLEPITKWYKKKQKEIEIFISIKNWFLLNE